MKILMAIDGSSFTKKMVAYLVLHPELFVRNQQHVTLLHVLPPLPQRAKAAMSKEMLLQYQAEEVDRVATPVQTFLGRHDIRSEVISKVGAPGSTIAQVAQDGDYDLLIMGSHGNSALANLVMGSVATQVLAHCKVPVLLVR